MIDKKTAEAIVVKYYDDVYKYCFSHLGCNEIKAEDVTQDVFLLLQEKCDELDDANIKAWLIKTARNKLHEHFREVKKNDVLVSFEDKLTSYEENDICALLEECIPVSNEDIEKHKEFILKGLTKKEQELYTKIFVEKKKHKEIAEEFNTSEKAVTVRSLRLRKKITMLIKLVLTLPCQFIIRLFLIF